ncbi:MAG: formylglycine-generating enzyme family protein, partial [Bacteroidota bacterium]|nr:formylglycine-generating enzyme family protein [Bacteroidota bacterium]
MNKQITIFFFYLIAALFWRMPCFAQGGQTESGAPARTGPKGSTDMPTSQKNAGANEAGIDVLFATNEDCRIYINKEAKGMISKDRFFYLKLSPGTYSYVARSEKTGDEWRDHFTISKGTSKEVFIDMLYAMDAARELRTADAVPVTAASNAGSLELQQAILQRIVGDMVPIEGGTFVMGNNKSPSKDEAEHPVMIGSFSMSKYEVTQEQWEGIMGYNPSLNKGCPDCPVENVSWEEVLIFLRKINGINNRNFRLPTEAEWEYVARMGGKEEIEKSGGPEAYIRKTAWAFVNSDNKTHPVGEKQPNVAGIHDL